MVGRIDVLTLFPELVEQFFETSLIGQARSSGLLALAAYDLRDWTADRHRTVDDAPYGGGPGMLMKPEPLVAAIEALAGPKGPDRVSRVILLSPQGKLLTQVGLERLAEAPGLLLVCGRYEGVDQRVVDLAVDEELSMGDYVLCGGEIPAMAVVEGVARLVPGVLGNPESARQESFGGGILEGPQYTRPPEFRGLSVPPVLLSGDHAAIERFRSEQARELTRQRRPELFGALDENQTDTCDAPRSERNREEER